MDATKNINNAYASITRYAREYLSQETKNKIKNHIKLTDNEKTEIIEAVRKNPMLEQSHAETLSWKECAKYVLELHQLSEAQKEKLDVIKRVVESVFKEPSVVLHAREPSLGKKRYDRGNLEIEAPQKKRSDPIKVPANKAEKIREAAVKTKEAVQKARNLAVELKPVLQNNPTPSNEQEITQKSLQKLARVFEEFGKVESIIGAFEFAEAQDALRGLTKELTENSKLFTDVRFLDGLLEINAAYEAQKNL